MWPDGEGVSPPLNSIVGTLFCITPQYSLYILLLLALTVINVPDMISILGVNTIIRAYKKVDHGLR